jgi:DNA-binding SARP family transcriptional activator
MTRLEVRLLGRPVVLVDGLATGPPKGAKAWGLLAYLALSDRPHPRSELAELLFAEADDPLGALRWNLAALRRLLGRPEALKGDAICLHPIDALIDVVQLEDDAGDGPPRPGDDQELLAGMTFADSPRFELWLTAARRRLGRRATTLLREATLRSIARGDHGVAIRLAGDLVSLEPLDEGHHALLIRAHALSGDAAGATQQLERCRSLLRTELDVEPGAAVMAAAHLVTRRGDAIGVDPQAVDARMTVAWQSFLGGSVDHAIDLGRSVVTMADRGGDDLLRITTRLFLAAMLEIAVRGWDEAATVATESLHLAERAGFPFEEAMARAVLAGSDLMKADYQAAMRHATLGAARCDEPGACSFNLAFLSGAEADTGHGARASEHAVRAVATAEETGDPLRIVYATAYAGQAALLGGDHVAARAPVERAVATAASILVLRPWPMALLAEIEVAAGHLDLATEIAGRAAALAATTDIAYQVALAHRALALVDAARGDDAAAIERLTVALGHARRTTGEGYSYHWPVAWILDSLATVAARSDPVASQLWAATLLDHADTVGMHTFTSRANAFLR